MSVEIVNLKNEINTLKQDIINRDASFEGLMSQIEGHREQLNESLNAGLTARSNVIYMKKLHNKVSSELKSELEKNATLRLELDNAVKRITELDAALTLATKEPKADLA